MPPHDPSRRRAALCLLASAAALAPRSVRGQARPPAPARPPAAGAPLTVRITSPHAGVIDADYVVALEATVSDPALRGAVLTVNGASYPVPVRDGVVRQQIVVTPGNNRVAVSVARGAGETASDAMTVFVRGQRTEFVVLVGWPSRGEIIDLWVREPRGETCKWDHRETRAGGRLLDFSSDAIGFGSQAYVLPEVLPGRYRVKVHYWGGFSAEDARGRDTYDEALARLDELDETLRDPATAAPARARLAAERARVAARLDQWASPAAPQTPVRAEVVLFPNGVHERRWRFDLVPQRTGQLLTLGEVEVSDAMVRAARAAQQGVRS